MVPNKKVLKMPIGRGCGRPIRGGPMAGHYFPFGDYF
jgi:hypothetical protein